ncbi:hypothetical protein LTR95_006533 [Oleoguttula sp. CCFEE 5521]
MATAQDACSFCSTFCKQGYIPSGVDGSDKRWQDDFLDDIGLSDITTGIWWTDDDPKTNSFLTAGEKIAALSQEAANDLGLPTNVAVHSSFIDAYACWISTVGAKVQLGHNNSSESKPQDHVSQAFIRVAAVAGTSTCHPAMNEKSVFVNSVWGPYRDVLISCYWMAEGGQSATIELLKHVVGIDPAFQEAMSVAETFNMNIYDYLNEHLREIDLFGNRSPIAEPEMKGSIIGVSSDTSMDSLAIAYHGTFEFIALQTDQIVESTNASGHVISSIFMSGSQCQNEVVMNLIAKACNIPVVIPRYVHAAVVHGAAISGAKAASTDKRGKSEPLWEIMNRLSKPGLTVYPNSDEGESQLLRAKYKVFLEQIQQQKKYRKQLDNVVANWRR